MEKYNLLCPFYLKKRLLKSGNALNFKFLSESDVISSLLLVFEDDNALALARDEKITYKEALKRLKMLSLLKNGSNKYTSLQNEYIQRGYLRKSEEYKRHILTKFPLLVCGYDKDDSLLELLKDNNIEYKLVDLEYFKDYINVFSRDKYTIKSYDESYVEVISAFNIISKLLKDGANIEDFLILAPTSYNDIISSFSSFYSLNVEEKVTELKNLYKFNDDMFSEAYENDKKVMMLLGTYAFSEPDFADYTNLTKLLYGDDFVYYYKGHPNTPTDMYPEKAQELNDLELYDIESTINAELILFYFPNIYMSGYSSSTFNSLQNEEMACVFWNSTKENALNISGQNAEMFDYYVSKLSLDDENYVSLLQQSDCKYYLIEINDLLDVNYSFAIYNATLNVLNYYDSNKQLISN